MNETFSVRIDQETARRLQEIKQQTGLTATSIIRNGLKDKLQQIAREGGITIKTNP